MLRLRGVFNIMLSLFSVLSCLPAVSSPIGDKTLMAWVKLADLKQAGTGVLSIEREAGQFDSIVFGETTPGKWMAGSDNWARTQRDQGAAPLEQSTKNTVVQIAVIYRGNQVSIVRNGVEYASYSIERPLTFPVTSTVLIGKRHLDAGGTPFFAGAILDARIYNSALTLPLITAQKIGEKSGVEPLAWWCFADGKLKDRMGNFPYAELKGGAKIKDHALILNGKGAYMSARTTEIRHPKVTSVINYRPKEPGFVGDPIPFYWRGSYHVFYLKAGGPAGAPWAHIVSKDLIHWKELPHAVVPGDKKDGPDYEGCWTGSIIEHDGVFHMFYTGKNSADPLGDQKVIHATSKDLITWTKQLEQTFYADGKIYWSKPVNGAIDALLPYHHQAFRDPEVFWNAAEKRWWMLLHACTAVNPSGVIGLYTSDDLNQWTPQQPVYQGNYSFDCPHIFMSGSKWYIIAAGVVYTSANSPGGPYNQLMQPYGAGLLEVPKGAFDGKRQLIWGWMWDQEGYADEGNGKWGGVLSMVREVYANDDGELHQRPVQEVINFFNKPVSGVKSAFKEPHSFKVPANYMLHSSVVMDGKAVMSVGFREQPGDAKSGYKLIVNPGEQFIELKNGGTRSVKLPCKLDVSKPIDIRVFVLNDIIECFVDDAHAVSLHAYNFKTGSLSFGWEGGGSVQALTVNAPAKGD